MLRTLGTFELEGIHLSPQQLCVLCFIFLEREQNRQKLKDMFFANTRNPPNSLGQVLYELHEKLRSIGVISQEDNLLETPFDQWELKLDVLELYNAFKKQDYEYVVALYQGEFLDQYGKRKDTRKGKKLEKWIVKVSNKTKDCADKAKKALAEKLASE